MVLVVLVWSEQTRPRAAPCVGATPVPHHILGCSPAQCSQYTPIQQDGRSHGHRGTPKKRWLPPHLPASRSPQQPSAVRWHRGPDPVPMGCPRHRVPPRRPASPPGDLGILGQRGKKKPTVVTTSAPSPSCPPPLCLLSPQDALLSLGAVIDVSSLRDALRDAVLSLLPKVVGGDPGRCWGGGSTGCFWV